MRKDGTLLDVSLSVSPIVTPTGTIVGASKIARDITLQKQTEEALREETRMLELLNVTGQSIAAQLDLEGLVQTRDGRRDGPERRKVRRVLLQRHQCHRASRSRSTRCPARRARRSRRFGLPRNTPVVRGRLSAAKRSCVAPISPRIRATAHVAASRHARRASAGAQLSCSSGDVAHRRGHGGLFFGHPEPGVFTERAERLVLAVRRTGCRGNRQRAPLRGCADGNPPSRSRRKRRCARPIGARMNSSRRSRTSCAIPLLPSDRPRLISSRRRRPRRRSAGATKSSIARSQHMALLLDDLLDISRITRGTLELRTEMTDLATVVDAAVETARPAIDAKRHRAVDRPAIRARLFRGRSAACGPGALEPLTNAAKYTDPGGQIRLRAACEAGTVTLSVRTTALGFPPMRWRRFSRCFRRSSRARIAPRAALGSGSLCPRVWSSFMAARSKRRARAPGRGASSSCAFRCATSPHRHLSTRINRRSNPPSGDEY